MKCFLYLSRNIFGFAFPLIFYILLIPLPSPAQVVSTTRYVAQTAADCTALGATSCSTTIQNAVDATITACENLTGNNDTIIIAPGTYTTVLFPAITKDCSLTMYGKETARTVLSGGTSETLITAQNSNSAVNLSLTIYNLKFQNAGTGIRISNSVSITLKNSIFERITGTAISLTTPQAASITNNTFYLNGVAIARDSNTPSIKNNIFYGNTVAISTNSSSNLSKNCYFSNGDDSAATLIRESTAIEQDPSFVALANGDFHLLVDSPCVNTGDTSVGSDVLVRPGNTSDPTADVGAYGGPSADTIPFQVVATPSPTVSFDSGTSTYTITVSWSPNLCYLIGGYKISYGTVSGSYGSSVTVANPAASSGDIPNLVPSITTPSGTPSLSKEFANQLITISWNPELITGETGFEIRYDTTTPVPLPPAAHDPAKTLDVTSSASSSTFLDLQNGTTYYFVIIPFTQDIYYIVVQSFYDVNPAFLSIYSNEVNATLSSAKRYGTPSSEIHEFPEPVTPNPNLLNKGCFIATAAYGYYSAPQVQSLREFRDRYLVTNAPGRTFVRWYYRNGPIAAQFINEHPVFKPVVRAALMPAVGGAMFMTRTSAFTKIIVFMFIGSLAIIRFRKIFTSSANAATTKKGHTL